MSKKVKGQFGFLSEARDADFKRVSIAEKKQARSLGRGEVTCEMRADLRRHLFRKDARA